MFISIKSLLASTLLLTLAASEVSAHSIFTSSNAAATAAKRSDVTRAGKCNAAAALAAPITAAANGGFTVFAKSLNGGADGASTVKSATLDTTGKGTTFNGKVTATGGVAQPKTNQVAQIQMTLPAGTTCTGTGGACLVAIASTGGFGNCVAVKPAGGAAAAGGGGNANNAAAATGGNKNAAAAKNNKGKKGNNKRFHAMRRLERQLDEARVEVARHLAELDAEIEAREVEVNGSDLDELDDEEDVSDLEELDE